MNELVKIYNDGTMELKVVFKMINGLVYAKANSMADSTKLDNWKRSVNTKRYLEALEGRSVKSTEWILSNNGGNEQGTWIHEKLVLNLARYISVDFEIWCDEMIATLIREGEMNLSKPSYTIENPIERAKKWIEEQEAHQLEIKQKEEIIVEQTPKVEYYEKVLDTSTCYTVTQVAKLYETTAVSLNKILQNQGIQFYQSGQWQLYAKYQGKGYADIRTHKLDNGTTRKSLVWTERGIEFIGRIYRGDLTPLFYWTLCWKYCKL